MAGIRGVAAGVLSPVGFGRADHAWLDERASEATRQGVSDGD